MQTLYEEQRIYTADELLGPNVTKDILDKAEQWLYYLADKLDVEPNTIKPSFIVQELIQAYAYREVCTCKSYSLGNSWGNQDVDYYSRKLKYYQDRIDNIEKNITASELTGNAEGSKGYRAVTITRG